MRTFKNSILFKRNVGKLKGQGLKNVLKKIDEILECKDIDHYKNLQYNLKKFKRVHINDSYVILFFGDDGCIYFVDYDHHKNIYKYSKKSLKKYENLKFE